MATPRLSLCLIARDEESMLPGCFESVRGLVQEIVLVDTGSRDRTVELARAAGAKILSRPWDDDFAAPRTLAARFATGDFILQLDADERLAPGAGAGLLRAIAEGPFLLGLLRLHNASKEGASAAEILSGAARSERPFLVPRLLANTGDVEYRGRIHENVLDWMERHGDGRRFVDADILHLGYVPAVRISRAKRERNVGLLRRRLAEEKNGVVPAGYLAMELVQIGDFQGAREVVDAAWDGLDRAPRSHSGFRLALARAALALRRLDVGQVLDSLDRAERREGPHPDLDFLRGMAHEMAAVRSAPGSPQREDHLRRAQAALESSRARLEDAVWEFTGAVTDLGLRLHLSAVHLLRSDPRRALEEAGAALRLDAQSPSAWGCAAEALLAAGEPGRALEAAQRSLGQGPDGWLVAAAAAADLGAAADARTFLDRARERAGGGFEHLHRVGRLRQLEERLAGGVASGS